jgi:chromosome segregation ATPase
VQTDCAAVISGAKQAAEEQERVCQDLTNRIQKLDVELRLKDEEVQGITNDINAKRVELSRLSSSRSAIQQCQVEFENAQRTHDEFMGSYNAKSTQYKKQIKVWATRSVSGHS